MARRSNPLPNSAPWSCAVSSALEVFSGSFPPRQTLARTESPKSKGIARAEIRVRLSDLDQQTLSFRSMLTSSPPLKPG